MGSKSTGLIRGMFSVVTLWVYLVFVEPAYSVISGKGPSSSVLGIIAIGLVVISYVGSGLLIRSLKKDDDPEV